MRRKANCSKHPKQNMRVCAVGVASCQSVATNGVHAGLVLASSLGPCAPWATTQNAHVRPPRGMGCCPPPPPPPPWVLSKRRVHGVVSFLVSQWLPPGSKPARQFYRVRSNVVWSLRTLPARCRGRFALLGTYPVRRRQRRRFLVGGSSLAAIPTSTSFLRPCLGKPWQRRPSTRRSMPLVPH